MKKILLILLAATLALGTSTSCKKDDVYYQVTFNPEGGSTVAPQDVIAGGHAKRPTDPTRAGYEFADWHLSGVDAAWNFSTDRVNSNITLLARWAVVGDGGMEDLQTSISDANDLNQDDYTADSWAALEAALLAAERVADDPAATPAQIAEALANLNSAMDNLVSKTAVDKSDLELAISVSEGTAVEGDYTPSAWQTLQDALAEAKSIAANPNATQQQVDNALQALQTAFDDKAADKSALAEAIAAAGALDQGNYTPDSWQNMQDYLDDANVVNNDPNATAQDIQTALTNLETALNGLVFDPNAGGNASGGSGAVTVDKSALNTRITAAGSYNQADFTASSWTNFQTVLNQARLVSADRAASQTQVDAALSNLNQAISALDHVVINDPNSNPTTDKSALQTFINDSSHLVQSDYTPESWANFKAAYDHAVTVNADSTATQSTIDSAYNTLQTEVNQLVRVQDSGAVRNLIDQLTAAINALPTVSQIQSNPLTAALAIVPATAADTTRDLLNSLLGGVDNTVVDGLNTQLNGILGALGLTSLI